MAFIASHLRPKIHLIGLIFVPIADPGEWTNDFKDDYPKQLYPMVKQNLRRQP